MRKTDKRRYQGRTQTLEQWANERNMSWRAFYRRMLQGSTFRQALNKPFVPKRNRVVVDGREVNLRQMALDAGLPYLCVWKRVVKLGWDLDVALSTPVSKRNRIAFKAPYFPSDTQ